MAKITPPPPTGTSASARLMNIVGCGDSLMAGSGAIPQTPLHVAITEGRDALGQTLAGLDSRTTAINHGVGGQTLATLQGSYAAATVDPAIVAGRLNILFARTGTNDFYGGSSAATVETLITNFVASRKAAGWDKVVLFTVTPRSDAGTNANFETNRVAYNTWLRANYASIGGDYLCDVGGDANIGTSGQETNTLYFDTSLVHQNNYGYHYVSRYMKQALASFGIISGSPQPTAGLAPSEVWIPAASFYAGSGTPTQALLSVTPVWQLHHGNASDAVVTSVRLPEHWVTWNLEAWFSNTTGGAGNAYLRGDLRTLRSGANLTTNSAGAGTAVAGPTAFLVSIAQLRAGDSGDVTKRQQIAVFRLGTNGADTLTDTIDLIGVRLVRAT